MEKSKSTRFPKQSRSSKRKSPVLTPADDKSDENGLESRKMVDLGSNKISSNYKTCNEDLPEKDNGVVHNAKIRNLGSGSEIIEGDINVTIGDLKFEGPVKRDFTDLSKISFNVLLKKDNLELTGKISIHDINRVGVDKKEDISEDALSESSGSKKLEGKIEDSPYVANESNTTSPQFHKFHIPPLGYDKQVGNYGGSFQERNEPNQFSWKYQESNPSTPRKQSQRWTHISFVGDTMLVNRDRFNDYSPYMGIEIPRMVSNEKTQDSQSSSSEEKLSSNM